MLPAEIVSGVVNGTDTDPSGETSSASNCAFAGSANATVTNWNDTAATDGTLRFEIMKRSASPGPMDCIVAEDASTRVPADAAHIPAMIIDTSRTNRIRPKNTP